MRNSLVAVSFLAVLILPAGYVKAAGADAAEGKTVVTDGFKIEIKDKNTGKTEVLYRGNSEDFLKSVTADSTFTKVFYIKRGRLFLMNTANKESKQYNLGPQQKIMYYLSAGISPDGKKLFGVSADLDGGAPNGLWVGEIKKYEEDEEDEYEGKIVHTEEAFKEGKWRKDSKFIDAELMSDEKVCVDTDKMKIVVSE